jgi:hypothetical protein
MIMSTVKTSGTCTACITPPSDQFHPLSSREGNLGSRMPQAFMNKSGSGSKDLNSGMLSLAGISIDPSEAEELRIFREFLELHVQENGICDVQCMLLWSEWVRAFRREAPGFPNLIREKEFRGVIADTYGVGISHDDFRGAVYPGIRYVP